MKRSLPGRDEVEIYWGLHFALAVAHQTIREGERLANCRRGSAIWMMWRGLSSGWWPWR
jgi:hypothetical protein